MKAGWRGPLTAPRVHQLVVAAGVTAGLLSVAGALVNPYRDDPLHLVLNVSMAILVGWTFLFVGLVAGRRRPENRVGLLMSLFGLTWFGDSVAWIDTPLTITVGDMLRLLYLAVLAHLYIVFPRGRPEGRLEARTIAAIYLWYVVITLAQTLTYDPVVVGCQGCRPNPLYIPGTAFLNPPASIASALGSLLLAAWVLVLLSRHWRRASAPLRRSLRPAIWAAVPIFLVVIGYQFTTAGLIPNRVLTVLGPVEEAIFAILPVALLVGVLRTRLGRGAVGDLVLELSRTPPPGALRDALARVLGDPSLELALAMPEGGFANSAGEAVTLPGPDRDRAVTMIPADGPPIAALIHDPELEEEDPELIKAAGSAARLALENERLQAEVRARLEEVRASRARILESADTERRRLERDLHDGAQQRLVALAIDLRMSRERAAALGDEPLIGELDHASSQLKSALSEIRQLARGVHPAVLTRAGIGPALRSLAEISPVAVEIQDAPDGRYPDAIEAAVYFCVSESLANVAKHARASRVTVSVRKEGDRLLVRIADDGIGGADAGRGSGIVGMTDRLAILGGRILVHSSDGKGTVIDAQIPCG